MKAVICEKYGSPEILSIEEVDKPIPKDGEILIKVMATSVNSGDVRIRALDAGGGLKGFVSKLGIRMLIGFRGPRKKILGSVLAGIVESTGENVDKFKPGDEVFAMTGLKFGGFGEYAVLSESKAVAKKPKSASFEEAASLPFGGTTAIYFLNKAGIENAKEVLIYGSTGAVGVAAVQIARNAGANVTTVSSEEGLELSKRLGASVTYDYKKTPVDEIKGKFDIVFDAVGKSSKKETAHLLSGDGKFATVGGVDVAKERASDLEIIATMFDQGLFEAVIDRTYKFDEMVDAHRYVDRGRKKGSVVVTFAN